jgi:hypothetical protein
MLRDAIIAHPAVAEGLILPDTDVTEKELCDVRREHEQRQRDPARCRRHSHSRRPARITMSGNVTTFDTLAASGASRA